MDKTLAVSLVENRKQKQELLRRMFSLSEKQKTELEHNELEKVSELSETWQSVASQVEALDAYYGEHLPSPETVEWEQEEDAPIWEEMGRLEEENGALLEQIRQLHDKNNRLAEQMMQTSRSELKNMQRSNERMQGYLSPFSPPESGTYFDQKK